MNSTLSDDELGARLRTALQEVSPLATDPLPTPRFAPSALPAGATTSVAGPDGDDVVELREPVAGRPLSSRRRTFAAVAVLAAAAAVVTVVVTVDRPGARDRGVPAGPRSASPAPLSTETVPERGGAYLGITPDPDPWRCTAPAGRTIAATRDPDQYRPTVWTLASGVTCAPYTADRGRFTFSDDGRSAAFGAGGPDEVTGGNGDYCLYVATATSPRDPSFTSRGAVDYLEFYGPRCRLVLPSR